MREGGEREREGGRGGGTGRERGKRQGERKEGEREREEGTVTYSMHKSGAGRVGGGDNFRATNYTRKNQFIICTYDPPALL